MELVQTFFKHLRLCSMLLCLALPSFLPTTTHAQSYTAGYTKYQRGDFKGAERSLMQAVTKETSKSALANSWKLLGICQYMLGNKGGSTSSFKEALEINSEISIASGEVLDDSVIAHFDKIKSDILEANKPPPPPPPTQVVKAPIKKAVAPPVVVAVPTSDDAVAGTDANASVAEGPVASKNGGTFIIVQSDTPEANVMIDGILAGQVGSEIEVEPGPLMVEVAGPGDDGKTQKITAVKGHVNTLTVNLIKPPKLKKVVAKKPKKPRKPRKVSHKKKKSDEMFAGKPGAPQPAGFNQAAEFEADANGGMSPYAPAPPPYYGRPYQQPQMAMNNPAYDGRYESRAATHGNYFIAALPFGAGQFQNRAVGTGILFFAGEAGAIYFYMSKNKEASTTEADIAYYEQEAQANADDKTDEEKEADAAYIQDTRAYVASSRSKAKLGLYSFGLLWAAGAVEAYLNDPIAKAANPPERRSRIPGYGKKETFSNKFLTSEDRNYRTDWQVRLLPEVGTLETGREDPRLKLVWQLKF